MARQESRSAGKRERTHVMASVRLGVAEYAKVSAIAALEGIDKSAWMSRAISEAVYGKVVVIDKRVPRKRVPDEPKTSDPVEFPMLERSADSG